MCNKTSEKRTIIFGKPETTPCLIPVTHMSTPNCVYEPFMVDGSCYKVTALSLGSPHGAVIVDDVDAVNVADIGAALGNHPLFPKGASIVFIQIVDNKTVKSRLWQRGKGETPFTAEAVCVAAVAAIMLHKVLTDKATVLMGGSCFEVEWSKAKEEVSLTASADVLSKAV